MLEDGKSENGREASMWLMMSSLVLCPSLRSWAELVDVHFLNQICWRPTIFIDKSHFHDYFGAYRMIYIDGK